MPARHRLVLLLVALLGLIPALAFGWTHSPLVNLPVCTDAADQAAPTVIADGSGGMLVIWSDGRGGSGLNDIYVQHVLATGVVDPAWPVNGRLVCGATGAQTLPVGVSDGAGGVIVAWQDGRSGTSQDVYAGRVLASGALSPTWPVNGRAICTAIGNQSAVAIATDGLGGAFIAWQDLRGGATEDLYLHRVLASGSLAGGWNADGVAVCTLAQQQAAPALLADGTGNVIVAWQDNRAYTGVANVHDIYAARMLSTGARDVGWPGNGRAVCTAVSMQLFPMMAGDGAGGALISWLDYRANPTLMCCTQHVLASGAVDSAWPVNGTQMATGSVTSHLPYGLVSDGAGGAVALVEGTIGTTYSMLASHVQSNGVLDPAWGEAGIELRPGLTAPVPSSIATDGAGGVFVAWADPVGPSYHVYVHHALAAGIADPAYPVGGRPVCIANGTQPAVAVVTDGAGGALMAWQDSRSGNFDLYAQNVTTFGVLGDPKPTIVSVKDLPADAGGHVRIKWNASQMDVAPYFELGSYGVWRRVSAAAAAQAIARGAGPAGAGDLRPGAIRAIALNSNVTWWEAVGVVPARGDAWYTYVAETFRDSGATGNPFTAFRVEARAATQIGWWDSAPDSGYSVDNLAPAMPAPFTGEYASGTVHLHWNPNTERDLDSYRLYRDSDPTFEPSPSSRIATVQDTGYTDVAGAPYTYKLTAVDETGNESLAATLVPTGTADAGPPAAGREERFAAPSPNPAFDRTRFRFSLTRGGPARLAVYDAAGRLVRELANGPYAAGAHSCDWDLRDTNGGRVGAGLYFARLERPYGRAHVRRLAITR